MIKEVNKVKINYELYGNKQEKTIVLLHGWGQNIQMMKPLGDSLSKEYQILVIDLPGHGNSEEPKEVWNLYNYVEAVHTLITSLKIKQPVLVGHSFGGKISLLYASKYEVKKLIILAAPFKKEIQKLSLKTRCLKALKKVPGLNKLENWAKQHMGSTDYRNASPIMRQILVNHVNLDITEEIKKIAGNPGTKRGTGGMATKIKAAKFATEKGITVAIGSGKDPEIIYDFIEGKNPGTIFIPKKN